MKHRHIWRLLAVTGLLASAATTAAQTSDQIAAQWRSAKRAEIQAQIAALNKKLGQLDDKATPDSFAIAAIAPAPAPMPSPTPAPTPAPLPSPSPSPARAATTATDEDKAKAPPGTFGGLAFGVGISLTLDTGRKDRIGSASLDPNNIVRIDDKNNSNARVMLESHYFFTPDGAGPFGLKNVKNPSDEVRGSKEWGFGPFIALQPGSGEIIDAVGLGVMIGFRRPKAESGSFNLGLGAVIDPNVRILGDGIEANRPLPAGETEVRYRETSQLGVLLLSSFTF